MATIDDRDLQELIDLAKELFSIRENSWEERWLLRRADQALDPGRSSAMARSYGLPANRWL